MEIQSYTTPGAAKKNPCIDVLIVDNHDRVPPSDVREMLHREQFDLSRRANVILTQNQRGDLVAIKHRDRNKDEVVIERTDIFAYKPRFTIERQMAERALVGASG